MNQPGWGIKLPIHFPSKNMTKLFAKRVLGHQRRTELKFLRYNFKFELTHCKMNVDDLLVQWLEMDSSMRNGKSLNHNDCTCTSHDDNTRVTLHPAV